MANRVVDTSEHGRAPIYWLLFDEERKLATASMIASGRSFRMLWPASGKVCIRPMGKYLPVPPESDNLVFRL